MVTNTKTLLMIGMSTCLYMTMPTEMYAIGPAASVSLSQSHFLEKKFLYLAQGTSRPGAVGPSFSGRDLEIVEDDSEEIPRFPLLFPPLADLDVVATELIVREIEDTSDECDRLPRQYHVDCLSKGFSRISKSLPTTRDMVPVRDALDRVSVELLAIVRAERDREQSELSIRRKVPSAARGKVTSNIRPIKNQSVNQANQEAANSVDEAKRILLRSVPSGDPRAVHYTRIADAFDGGAILLRS